MTKDPIAQQFTRRRRIALFLTRYAAWVAFIAAAVAVAAFALGLVAISQTSDESKARTAQLQAAFCGLLVPVSNAPLPPNVSIFGRTIKVASKHGAVVLHCPNPKP